MKTQKIRILFVEDIEADIELAIRVLQKGKFDVNWEQTKTWDGYISKLSNFNPDVIICNYSIPTFNGPDALDKTLNAANGIPLILYTTPTDEEIAVECIKNGATDYVIKNNRKRLLSSVREAVDNLKTGRTTRENRKTIWLNETRYRTATETGNGIAFLKDDEGRYTYVNEEMMTLLGKNEPDIIGKTDFDLMPDEVATRLVKSDTNAMETKTLVETSDKIKNKIYQIKKFPVVLENGKVGVGGFLNEMGAVKEAEVNLKQQGTALYTAENAVAIYDTSGNILSINPAFTRLTGFTPTDALGMNIDELLNTDTLNEELYQNIWNTILNGEIWHGVMTNRKKDSNTYHEKVTITPVTNSEGVISQFITHRQNITEQAMTEMNNQGTDWNYNELVNNANIGICTVSLQGKILHANDVMVSLLELSNNDNLRSTNMPTVFRHPEHWKILLEGVLTNSLVQNLDVEMITALGRIRSVVLNAILDGNKIKLMVLDVTPQRKVEADLQKTKIKADENEQLRNTFLTNLGHDLRIPISAIHGFTGLLSSTGTPIKDKERYVELINESSQQLLRLVNGFIELSRIATGDATVNPISFSLNNLLRQMYAELRPETLKKNLNLTYHLGVADNLSRIRFDDQKLKAILTNLLENAIKYTDRGTIDFGYEISGSTVELFIRDTGRGISPDYQKVILDRFRVLEDPYTRKFEGHGLGLPISKAYTELLGGKIHVNSQVNVGSEFIFTIPYLPVSETIQSTPDKLIKDLNLDNHKILVVEDDEVNFMFIERLLNKTNVTILRAINGQEAVNICANDDTIDMVLMDIHLPFMNGLEATRIIKHKSPELPVIAVTAYSQSDDKATCLAAGCDDYIPKPINRSELYSKLNNYLVN